MQRLGDYMANKKQKINIRRIINWLLFLVAVVLLCLIAAKLYNIYESNKLKNSVLTRVVGTIQYDDVENATGEFVSDDFILISYVKSEDVRNFESKLKTVIVNNELQSNFYYFDATDLMLEDNYIETLNEKFKLKDTNKIEALPALLYYKNGEFVKTLSSTKDKIMSADDFSKLLDSYEILERK